MPEDVVMSARIGVVSLNVCGLPSSLPAAGVRAAEFCRLLEESGVHVVNFQEVWTPRLLASIRDRLPSFAFHAWRRGLAGQPRGGLASFSRLPVEGVAFTSFRGVRPAAGTPWFRGMKAVNSRLQGVLTFRLVGQRAVVGNVHLSANRDGDWSAGNRHHGFQRAQLAALHDTLRRARTTDTGVTILSGDLNIASRSSLYPLITEGGAWRDPFAPADEPTFRTELLPPGRTPHRIDYLLLRGDPRCYPVTEAALLFTEPAVSPEGRRMLLSDHLGLTAQVGIPDAGLP
jgi:endonuclease/exonuclease/phosphatase (EEP) superfamily protein YafD